MGLGTGVVKGILNSVFKLILTMHFFTVYFISLGKKWSWSLVPGRVPAFSTDTLPEIMRVSVLIAGTRPGTIGHPVVIILWPDIPYLKGAAMSTTNPWQIGWLAFGHHEIGKTTLNLIHKWLRRSSIGRANRRMLVRCWNTSVEQDNGKIQNGISSSKLSQL